MKDEINTQVFSKLLLTKPIKRVHTFQIVRILHPRLVPQSVLQQQLMVLPPRTHAITAIHRQKLTQQFLAMKEFGLARLCPVL